MYKRLIGFLMATMMLAVLAVGSATGVAADTAYTCPNNSCTFSVPDYYNELSKDSTTLTFKDANSGGVFSISVVDVPAALTLNDIATVVVQQVSSLNNYQSLGNVTAATVGGNPARQIAFQAVNPSGTAYTQNSFITTYQGRTYLLSFVTTPDAEDAFLAAAQPVLDSFMFM